MVKICTKCKIEKNVEYFSTSKTGLYGRKSTCKECVKLYNKQYYKNRYENDEKYREYCNRKSLEWIKNNPEKRAIIAKKRNQKYRKEKPEKIKEFRERYKNKYPEKYKQQRKEVCDRYYSKNKQKYKEYRIKNNEKIKEKNKQYQIQNRAKVYINVINRKQKQKDNLCPFRNDNIIKCLYDCAIRLNNCLKIKFHVDHILPINKGGKHHENNLQIIPAKFNVEKQDNINYECAYPNYKKPAQI